MRYNLRHATTYTYGTPVDLSYQLTHIRLTDRPRQQVLRCETSTDPGGAKHQMHTDHFGNLMEMVAIVEPHDRLEVLMTAEVEIAPMPVLNPEASPPWENIVQALNGDGFPDDVQAAEFVQASSMAEADAAIGDYARESLLAGRPILSAALDLTARIYNDFKYDPTATDVFSPVAAVMAQRAGVCQDFAHLQIAMLRSCGLAARYVSGYIRTFPPADSAALRGSDATHAWLGVWCGAELGWIDLDPTNNLLCSDQHVVAAIGRDYGDVSPVRGVVLGGGAQQIAVAVELNPLQ